MSDPLAVALLLVYLCVTSGRLIGHGLAEQARRTLRRRRAAL